MCRLVPHTPCGKIFNYFESETREIFASLTLPNDLSGKYHLKVTMSIPTKTDKVKNKMMVNGIKLDLIVF